MKASHVTNILLVLIAATQFLILRNANKPETPETPETPTKSSPLKVKVVETVGYRGGPISVSQGYDTVRVQVTNWPIPDNRVQVINWPYNLTR